MTGLLTSSLHRLKDTDNKDGGFFVFGDISVRRQGRFRLKFSLFELRDLKGGNPHVIYLNSIISGIMTVLNQKEFKGTEESTYISRSFSDQGVRLRLRKEPRAAVAKKRNYDQFREDQLT